MEMVGLHVYSILDTNILVVDHCDCSKTAFRWQKMLCYAEKLRSEKEESISYSHDCISVARSCLLQHSFSVG